MISTTNKFLFEKESGVRGHRGADPRVKLRLFGGVF
jgi:hypothetical protein